MFAYCLLVVGLVDRTLLVGCLSVGWWVVGLLWRVVGGTDFACWLVVCLLVGRTLLVGGSDWTDRSLAEQSNQVKLVHHHLIHCSGQFE